jgi:hypothetical protein
MVSPSYASNKKLAWIIVGDKSKARISQTGELHALKSAKLLSSWSKYLTEFSVLVVSTIASASSSGG